MFNFPKATSDNNLRKGLAAEKIKGVRFSARSDVSTFVLFGGIYRANSNFLWFLNK